MYHISKNGKKISPFEMDSFHGSVQILQFNEHLLSCYLDS